MPQACVLKVEVKTPPPPPPRPLPPRIEAPQEVLGGLRRACFGRTVALTSPLPPPPLTLNPVMRDNGVVPSGHVAANAVADCTTSKGRRIGHLPKPPNFLIPKPCKFSKLC